MKTEVKFATYNPIINFVFFIGAIVLGMFFMHPAFLLCSVVLSFTLFASIKGLKAFKFLLSMFPLFILITLINPVFNIYGQTVLFNLFNRPYTLEALYYGIAMASMFISVLLWFASYNEIMTSDKFIYIFGRVIPSVSMIFTMILRLIPNYRNKLIQISTARKCIGMSDSSGNRRQKISNSMSEVSSLTSWAFEGGIVTADSMKSRGYGAGKRTNFSIYRFDARDKLLTVVMLILVACTVYCAAMGGTKVIYVPTASIAGVSNPYTIIGLISYFVFLFTPTLLNITEAMTWRILRSRI